MDNLRTGAGIYCIDTSVPEDVRKKWPRQKGAALHTEYKKMFYVPQSNPW